ncbi:Hypothetical protein, putative [Bodo saltans]|uniref:Uncharacterized protein n=1 Tax=Bodo saltans TaxID=75058 RepID=A0A0S4JS95_BODSA|nr:Hypothetical protein, putative [Bodo saltans]|eukprot:CUG93680.1 Hypothetical protein, putative [Bodo saltans]
MLRIEKVSLQHHPSPLGRRPKRAPELLPVSAVLLGGRGECYAETFPQHTADIILQGVYLGSMQEHAPQFQIGSAAAAAAAATMTIGAVSPSTSSVAMMKKERRNAAYREAFELFSQQVEVAVAARRIDGVASTPSLTLSKEVLSVAAQGGSEPASPSPSPSSSLSNWVDDPFLLHSLYRDYILSFVPLQQAALDEYNNSNINKTSGATDDDDELLQRKKRLSRTVALHPLEGKPYATFSVPDNGQPCVCNDQADNNDDYHRNNTPKQLCCMERAHRALAMWSLYENFLTYPTEQTYYLDKMRVAADMRKPYRASHKDITGALMQLFLFPSMMARGGGKTVRDGALLPVIPTSNNNNVVSGGGSVKSGVAGCTCGATLSADTFSSSKPCTTTTMNKDQHQQHQQQHALWCPQVLSRVITPPSSTSVSSSSRPYRKMWVVHGADDEVCPPFAAEALASIAASLCHPPQKPEERGQKQQQNASASSASGKKRPSNTSKPCNRGAGDGGGNACTSSNHRSKVVKLWLVDDASHDSLDGGAMEDAFLRFAEEMAEDVVDRWL